MGDTAPLHEVAGLVLAACPDTRDARPDARLAATLTGSPPDGAGIVVDEASVPVSETTRGAAEILGLIRFTSRTKESSSHRPGLRRSIRCRTHPLGERAARIGTVTDGDAGLVTVRTALGGERLLDLPFSEPLPRIC